jgi:Di- and tricarboxylate transporters
MNSELAIVVFLLAATTLMFALNRPRMDAVALIMMTILPLTGVITVSEALAGLSDPNVVLIGALFVIGEGLVRTGIAQRLGDFLVRRANGSERRLIALLMTVVGGVGSVMSSTGVVALFIPTVLRIARRAKISPSRLLMPLSVAALVSGMMTLIATPPNLIVHGELVRSGYEGFHFFSFTVFGIPILLVAIGYMLVARRWLEPSAAPEETRSRPSLAQWIEEYGLAGRHYQLRVKSGSPWIGKRLEELELRKKHGLNVLAIERQQRLAATILAPGAQTALRAGDVLYVDLRPSGQRIETLLQECGLQEVPLKDNRFSDRSQAIGMAELLIPATSRLIGETVISSRFRSIFRLSVIGLRRGKTPVMGNVLEEPLRLGDTLLVAGPWRAISRLQNDPNELIVLNVPTELDDVIALPARAPFALVALAVTVALMVTGVVPNVQAALIGCLLMGLFRCVDMSAAYRSIQWGTIFLIVGMLPFSLALQKTGGVDAAARLLLGQLGDTSPTLILVTLYVLTSLMGLFVSNTATAVLVAPIALAMAREMGLSPYPFAMTVALASSAAFLTPVSSPVNALVVGPGNYRFLDFVRIGLPLTLLVMIVSILLIRLLLPF